MDDNETTLNTAIYTGFCANISHDKPTPSCPAFRMTAWSIRLPDLCCQHLHTFMRDMSRKVPREEGKAGYVAFKQDHAAAHERKGV